MNNRFTLEQLFIASTGDVDLQQRDVNGKGTFFINSGVENRGIKGKTDREAKVFPANTITIDFWGNAYYRDFEYKMATHNHVFSLSGDVIKDDKVGLYLAAVLSKLSEQFSYSNMATWNKLKTMSISLPVVKKPNSDYEYTVDDIDFQYMRERITELERERITELERERITELDAYLKVTGLNDYELTEEDKKILSLSRRATSDEGKDLEDIGEDGVRFYLFRVDEVFEVVGTKSLDAGAIEFKEEGINFVGRTYENNGIQGKIDRQSYEPNGANTITATVIGNYKYVKYQEEPYYCSQNINKLTLLDKYEYTLNRLSADYLIALIRKFVEQYNGQQGGYKLPELKEYKMLLPITSSGEPDFDYMERYIRAIEKVVITDVVKYKEKVIEVTKQIIQA